MDRLIQLFVALLVLSAIFWLIESLFAANPRQPRGLTLDLPGLVLGALLAFITVAWLRDGFVSRNVSPFAVALAVVAGLVLLLAAASFGPARQAMRTQPAPLLRED